MCIADDGKLFNMGDELCEDECDVIERKLFYAKESDVGMRMDLFVSKSAGVTRNAAQKLISDGRVTVCGTEKIKNYKICAEDAVEIFLPVPELCDTVPQDIPLNVVYEDASVLVVNKTKGMVVHPAPGNRDGTLVNALLFYCGESLSGIGGVIRPGIVHRIDRDTSGLLIVAKNDFAHNFIAAQLSEHKLGRQYEAIVKGKLREENGIINAPIGRHPTDRKKMTVIKNGREAITHYETVRYYEGNSQREGYTHVRLTLETGRTHQIRVHMAYIGHPVLGDTVYGGDKTSFAASCASVLRGQCLHARTVEFVHPDTGELIKIDSELPEYFVTVLKRLENSYKK